MNKIILLAFTLFLLVGVNLKAQPITFTRIDPEIVRETVPLDSFAQLKSHAVVHNTTGSPISITIYIFNRYVTPGWDSIGLCNWVTCYVSGDTLFSNVTTPPGYDTLYTYFSPHKISGMGKCTVRITYQSTILEQTFTVMADPIGIQQISTIVKDFSLGQNYPNPFNPNTKINFSLSKAEFTYLRVYDILGREVKTLVAEPLSAGEYQVDFDAKGLSSGMYYYSLRAGDFVTVKKMVLVK
jgi:hypothetical protein